MFTKIIFKIASKLTSIVTILPNIALAGDHIFQVLSQYSWVLPQNVQVLSLYLRVLSRWIHPKAQKPLFHGTIYSKKNCKKYFDRDCKVGKVYYKMEIVSKQVTDVSA